MDLIITSGLGLALKVIGLKSEDFVGILITAFDNCHSFLFIFLYKLDRILSIKILGKW